MSELVRCRVVGQKLVMDVPIETLRWAAENHPDFWDGVSGVDVPNIKITVPSIFAYEVSRAINDEAEDGSTMLTRMLDKAIGNAVEEGAEGIDPDWGVLK